MKRDAVLGAGAVLLAAAVVLGLVWLTPYGMEPYDEPMVWAGAQRLLLGDRLFVDDWSYGTVYSLLTPLFVLSRWLGGGKEGLLLTTRYLYLLFSLGVAAALFVAFRRLVSWRSALLLAVLALVAFPTGTLAFPGFSYNSLAAFLSLLLLAIGIRDATTDAPSPRREAAAVAVALLCVIAHPGTGLGVAAYLLWRWYRSPRRMMTGSFVVGGSLAVLVFFLLPLLGADWSGLRHLSGAAGQPGSVRAVIKPYDAMMAFRVAAVAGAALFAARWGLQWAHFAFLAAVGLLLLRHPLTHSNGTMGPMVIWSFLGATLALAGLREVSVRRLLAPAWVYGGPAALGVMLVSTGGLDSSLNALAPVILVSSWVSLAVVERGRGLSAALHVVLIVFLVGERFRPYLDVPVWEPTRAVSAGVARGLRTTPENAAFLEGVHEALTRYEAVPGRVLVLGLPSVFHLETSLPPAAPHLYHCGREDPRCVAAYEKKAGETCLLVRKIGLRGKSEFERRLESEFETVYEGKGFAIGLRQDPGCRGNSTKLR